MEVLSDKTTSAPATVKEDGDAEAEVARDDDESISEPVVEVGEAAAPVVEKLRWRATAILT